MATMIVMTFDLAAKTFFSQETPYPRCELGELGGGGMRDRIGWTAQLAWQAEFRFSFCALSRHLSAFDSANSARYIVDISVENADRSSTSYPFLCNCHSR